jgi:hypothetical protein
MPSPCFLRGGVVRCSFPFQSQPHLPGPAPHYCLVIKREESEGAVTALAYGTSRLDPQMLSAQRGSILSVPTTALTGIHRPPGVVSHILCNHVAVLPDAWIDPHFNCRLGFMRNEKRTTPHLRALYDTFEDLELVLFRAADRVFDAFKQTRLLGLTAGSTLR